MFATHCGAGYEVFCLPEAAGRGIAIRAKYFEEGDIVYIVGCREVPQLWGLVTVGPTKV